MKIDLKSNANKREIVDVRSQIKDKEDLRKFDEFLASHDSFDFDNDDHINELRKNGDKNGDVFISLELKLD